MVLWLLETLYSSITYSRENNASAAAEKSAQESNQPFSCLPDVPHLLLCLHSACSEAVLFFYEPVSRDLDEASEGDPILPRKH